MRRREFIALLGSGATAVWPLVGRAQQIKKIGILGPAEEPRFSQVTAGLRSGLLEHGYAVGSLEFIEYRAPRGDIAGARSMTEDIVRRGGAALFVIGSELARAARQSSEGIPIVFITPGDPVAGGLVASLARPGGRTTAMTFEFPELSAKRLELLKALQPGLRSVLVLYDPRDASPRQSLVAAREAAPKLRIVLIEQEVRDHQEISRGLAAIEGADALLAVPGGITSAHHGDMIAAAK
jgi:putative tryptophan/tyrosine transport system substrate-binding protein